MKETKPKFRMQIWIGIFLPPYFEWHCANSEADDFVNENKKAYDFWCDDYPLSDYVVQP